MAVAESLFRLSSVYKPSLEIALGGLAIAYICWSLYTWQRLRHIPGPLSNTLSSWWLLRASQKGRFFEALKGLTDKYGELVRVGPNHVISSDIDVIRRLAGPKSGYVRGGWYGTFRFMPAVDHSFSILDEAKHVTYRNQIAPAYAGTNETEVRVGRQVMRLVDLIDRKYVSADGGSRVMDLATIAHFFAMEVIGDVTFGKPFGFLGEGEDVFGFLKWNTEFFPVMIPAASFPSAARILYWWPFTLLFPKESDPVGLGRFVAAARNRVNEKLQPDSVTAKQRDMIAMLSANGLTKDEVTSEAVLQVVAGTDSVATTIRMTLLYLIATPTAYRALQAELDSAFAGGKLSAPVTEAEARALPYLQACIREGARVFPGATPPLFKTAPAGGDVIAGYEIPAGTQVGHDIYGIARSKKYWGADADVFRPERWLDADEATLERMKEVAEIQFGFGRYKCLGRGLVFMELNKVLPELMRRYDFAVVNAAEPLYFLNAGFWLMKDMSVRITKRK